MAKDDDNLSTPSSSRHRSKPYDANNSFVKKVATKVTDLIPQRSWISKWFNSSQDETELQTTDMDSNEYSVYQDKQSQPPPIKRPCIRMDVTHPPGTFAIKPRSKNVSSELEPSKEHFSNHNDTTQDFLEPSTTGPRLHRFVSSTPAFQVDTSKVSEARSTLNMLMSEQNNNGAANGMDDNSESSESTSGCSSLIPQNNRQETSTNANYNSPFGSKRRYIDDKLSFTNHLQSPRSLFLDSSNRETLSSRQPSFNAVMMNNTLERSSSLSSPFYAGNTTFGGANAANLYRRSNSLLSDPSQYQSKIPQRTSVQVNPASNTSTSELSGMSHTARRILEALEQFSSPLSDAKKMPIRSSVVQNTSPTLNRKRPREEDAHTPRVGLRHLTRELTVPTVPDLLRIRKRQRLQNTTVNARKIMSARSAPSQLPSQDYQIRNETDSEPKHINQLKAKKKTNLEEEETVEALNLPTIPLPISTLPSFDISLPQYTKPVTPEKQQPQILQTKSDKDDSFKFASPIKLTDGAKNLESINNFIFSKPMSPSKIISSLSMNESNQELSKTLSIESDDTFNSTTSSFPNFIWAGPSQTLKPKLKNDESIIPKVASELKSTDIMEFFANKSSSELSNVWECNECLIKNSEKETHCVACKSSKPESNDDIEILECPNDNKVSKSKSQSQEESKLPIFNTKTSTSSTSSPSIFGKSNSTPLSTADKSSIFDSVVTKTTKDKLETETVSTTVSKPSTITTSVNDSLATTPLISAFKPAKSSWECPCCMVRNVETVTTCPCCNTAKPGSVNISPKRTIVETTTATTKTETSGFGDKFKAPEGAWSCDTCMLQNKSEADKCIACETSRPGAAPKPTSGFGDLFKKPEGSWTCDSCMLSNKPEATKCIACETPKAGESKSTSKLQINVDVPANASTFKFGIDKAGDTTKSTIPSLPKTNGFTFGINSTSQASTGGFRLDVPNSNKEKEATKTEGFCFKPNETVTTAATFQFGTQPVEKKDEDKAKPTANFAFGSSTKTDSKPLSAGFVFGSPTSNANSTTEKEKKTDTVTAGFTFGDPTRTAQSDKDKEKSTINLIQPKESESKPTNEVAPSNLFTFGSPQSVEVEKKEEAPKPTFSAPTEQKPAVPAFSFGVSTTSSTPAVPATSSLFAFSGQPKSVAATTALPTFGSPDAPKATFSFPKLTETSASTAAVSTQPENNTAALTFGTANDASKKMVCFENPINQTPSLFGNVTANASPAPSLSTSNNQPLMFGAPENKIAPTFGTNTENKPETSGFAASNNASASSPFGSTSSSFGSAAPSAFGSTSTPSFFASTKPLESTPSNPSLFSFGQSSQASTTGGFFSVGSNVAATSEQKPPGIFAFGGSTGGPVGNGFGVPSGGFNAASTPAAITSSFSFNAPPKAEVPTATGFGQVASTPMFNAPSATSAVAAPPPAYPGTTNTAPATGGFNFDSTNIPSSFNFTNSAPTSGGFNFNAPSNPAPAVNFDPNAQPVFNFTAGSTPPVFNAPPARKIKKAVRRMPRQ